MRLIVLQHQHDVRAVVFELHLRRTLPLHPVHARAHVVPQPPPPNLNTQAFGLDSGPCPCSPSLCEGGEMLAYSAKGAALGREHGGDENWMVV